MATNVSPRRFAVRRTHLNTGWRYWAFELATGDEGGLDVNGYGTLEEAHAAIAALGGELCCCGRCLALTRSAA